jgi:hypothetical protein
MNPPSFLLLATSWPTSVGVNDSSIFATCSFFLNKVPGSLKNRSPWSRVSTRVLGGCELLPGPLDCLVTLLQTKQTSEISRFLVFF